MTRWDGINRTAVIVVRVTPEEKRRLEQRAKKAGLSVGAWIRAKCLGRQKEKRP